MFRDFLVSLSLSLLLAGGIAVVLPACAPLAPDLSPPTSSVLQLVPASDLLLIEDAVAADDAGSAVGPQPTF